MDVDQASPLFNIVYYREADLVARGIEVDDPDGHFFTVVKEGPPPQLEDIQQWQYMTPKPEEPGPTHPLIQCGTCKHVFFPDKFYSHACGQKALEPPRAPPVRGVIASSIALHKNDLMEVPLIGAPLFTNYDGDGKQIKLKGDARDCIGIYAGAGPMINNQNGGVDRSILVLLQQ